MKTYSFETLNVWQCSRRLAKDVYTITSTFPTDEKFGITSQMRRAAISVCSNLAEGSGKKARKEKAKYTRTAYCSLMELLNQCIISVDLHYMRDVEMNLLREQMDEIAAKTSRLLESQLKEKITKPH